MAQAETLPFHVEENLGDELEEVIRSAYDDYCNGDTYSTYLAIRQAAREAFHLGRVFEREYGMKTPEKRRGARGDTERPA